MVLHSGDELGRSGVQDGNALAKQRTVTQRQGNDPHSCGSAMIHIAAAQFCLAIIRRGMVMRVQAVHDGAEQRLGIVSDRVVFRWHGILMQWERESAAERINDQFCNEDSCRALAMRRPSEHGNCTGTHGSGSSWLGFVMHSETTKWI